MKLRPHLRLPGTLSRNRTALLLLLSQFGIAGGAFVVNILSARAMGPGARGELALFLQVAYAANLVCLLGRPKSFLRFPPKSRSLPDSYADVRRLTSVPLLMSVAVAIVVGIAFERWSVAALILIVSFFVKLSSGITVNMHRAGAIAAGEAKPYLCATVAGQLLLVAGAVGFMVIEVNDPAPWLLLYGISAAIPYLLVEYLVSRRGAAQRRTTDELRQVSRLGISLVPAAVGEAVLGRADRFLLPALSTYAQLGVYAVVLTMTELVVWPATQLAQSRIPSWQAAFNAGELKLKRTFVKLMLISAGISVVFGGGIFFALEPIFGPEYADGRALVAPLIIGALLQCVISFGVSVGVAAGWPHAVTAISLSGLAFALPCLLLTVPACGARGAAWSMVAGYTVGAVAALFTMVLATRRSRLTQMARKSEV